MSYNMKTLNLSLLLVVLLESTLFISMIGDANKAGPEDYKFLEERLENTKAYTIEVIDAMPIESFNYKPSDDVRSFNAQGFHIAYSLEWFNASLKGSPIAWEPGDEERMSKEELITYTKEQFDAVKMTIMKGSSSDEFTEGIVSVLDHNSHHRGQMVTYLRLKGITPPSYR